VTFAPFGSGLRSAAVLILTPRSLPLLSLFVLFAIVALVCRNDESPLRLAAHRRLIYTASFAASCSMALFTLAGCGGGGAAAAQTAPITQQALPPRALPSFRSR
jgi:hypothetical protein